MKNRKNHLKGRALRRNIAGYLFIAPAMAGFIIFMLIPTITTVVLSFFEWNVVTDPVFAGIENYTAVFADPLFWNSYTGKPDPCIYHGNCLEAEDPRRRDIPYSLCTSMDHYADHYFLYMEMDLRSEFRNIKLSGKKPGDGFKQCH